MKKGFTLIELLVVVAIMGLMGTAAVGGYRSMQRGMSDRGVMQNVNQFIRSAYQRAQIDRTPVAIYFWNETLQEETASLPLIVVGKAVAVRRQGRLSDVSGAYLFDEFNDLRFQSQFFFLNDEGGADADSSGDSNSPPMYLYPMNGPSDGTTVKRSEVSQITFKRDFTERSAQNSTENYPMSVYAFYVQNANGVQWKRGDAYGLEFANIQLPHGYLFGTSFSRSTSNPVSGEQLIRFKVGVNTGSGTMDGFEGKSTIDISNLRPGASGDIEAKKVATSDKPDKSLYN